MRPREGVGSVVWRLLQGAGMIGAEFGPQVESACAVGEESNMRRVSGGWLLVALWVLVVGCSSESGKSDVASEVDVRASDQVADVTGGPGDSVDDGASVDVTLPPDVSDLEGTPDALVEVTEDVVEEPFEEVVESVVPIDEPSCENCVIVKHDGWDGSWDPAGPSQGTYDFPWTDDGGKDWIFYFRPWMRFRVSHPGTVNRILLYTDGGPGALEVQLSTGFPGGHYPCLDEMTGEDSYPIGKPFVMAVSEEPGWREIDVAGLNHEMLGYDEFFVLWRHVDDVRVALAPPAPAVQGDYGAYGGLIADAPGDQMTCFSSMDNFKDPDEEPLVWLVRVEIEASEIADKHQFTDMGDDGPKIGGHVSFGDFDNDGDPDLLTGGTLWQNIGEGEFVKMGEEAGLAGLGGETVWGDYDNDGWRDILGVGGIGTIFRNTGEGTFENITEQAGLNLDANSQGVAWVDIDQDGFLDFYSASYGTQADGEKATRDFVYISNGDGTFTDMTEELGVPVKPIFYHGRGLCHADYDQDGDIDIYVGNYRLDPNQLWQNGGGLAGFEDVSWDAGVKGNFAQGAWGHAIGPSFGDLDGDGWQDLVVANLAHPRFWTFSDPTLVYLNNHDGTFYQMASTPFEEPESGILYDETHSDSTIFDADNDGDLDLFLTSVYEGRRSYLYANDGLGHFTDVTYNAGIAHFNGWGSAAADIDQDGDMDLVAHRLFRNDLGTNGALRVRLVGGATPGGTSGWSNRDAIGAVAMLKVGDQTLARQVEGGTGVGCQNDSVLHFGLGDSPSATKLTVLWPSGEETVVSAGLNAGELVIVSEKK